MVKLETQVDWRIEEERLMDDSRVFNLVSGVVCIQAADEAAALEAMALLNDQAKLFPPEIRGQG